MILSKEAVELVKARRKTQIRFPADLGDPQRVGELYKVRAMGEKQTLEITVVGVRDETLGDMSAKELPKLGYRFHGEFRKAWLEKYPYDMDMRVWVVDFVVGDLRDKFDKPRLLKATPGKAGDEVEEHQDYTSRWALAAESEPEALTEAQLKPYLQENHAKDDLRARMSAASRPRSERVKCLEDRAREGDSEARRALWLIDQKLQASERRRARLEDRK